MPGNDLVLFDGVSVPEPLSVRVLRCPFNTVISLIVDGPPGAVELQIHPSQLDSPLGGGMSVEYHSRQPTPIAENPQHNCDVLGGATCYPDGTAVAPAAFQPWLDNGDAQAIVDELVRRHQATTWTLPDENTPDGPPPLATEPEVTGQLPAAGEVPPWA